MTNPLVSKNVDQIINQKIETPTHHQVPHHLKNINTIKDDNIVTTVNLHILNKNINHLQPIQNQLNIMDDVITIIEATAIMPNIRQHH